MQVREFSAFKSSVEQAPERDGEQDTEHKSVARDPAIRTQCPDCGGRVLAADEESVCSDCGLVVAAEFIDRGPTLVDLGMKGFEPESSIETVTSFRTDNGLHTTIRTGTDGRGNPLSEDDRRKARRLQKYHKRYQFRGSGDQSKRHNEALRDVQMLVGNLGLPNVVGEEAARWVQRAKDEGLPGGHMAWESLAGGGIWLAAGRYDLSRPPAEVAQYAKTSTERLCAAARKLRVELGLSVAPGRADVVGTVIERVAADLPDDADEARVAMVESQRLVDVTRHLMTLADEVPVGPGTPRATVAASAVYAALKLLGETQTATRFVTRAQLVEAVSGLVEASTGKLSRYNCELVDAFEARHGTRDPAVVLERDAAAD